VPGADFSLSSNREGTYVSKKGKPSKKNKVYDDRMRSDQRRVNDNQIENRIIEE
jgi:hypothetical protein